MSDRPSFMAPILPSAYATLIALPAHAQPCKPVLGGAIGVPGTDGIVESLIVFDDGTGPALFGGGHFTTAEGVTVNGIARWDGTSWFAMGSGTDNWVRALSTGDVNSDGTNDLLIGALSTDHNRQSETGESCLVAWFRSPFRPTNSAKEASKQRG